MLLKGMLPGISAHSTFTLAASNQNMHVCLIAQSCPTLCDPKDCSPPGSSVHGILQARILEWVAIYSPRESSQPRDQTCISCITGRFFTTELQWKPHSGNIYTTSKHFNSKCFSPTRKRVVRTALDSKEIKPMNPKGNQPWIFIGRTDAEAEAPILWPPDAKCRVIVKDPDAGKGWGQEEKEMTEDETVGWYHQLNGHEFEQTAEDSEGQGSLSQYSPWDLKESDTTEQMNNKTEQQWRKLLSGGEGWGGNEAGATGNRDRCGESTQVLLVSGCSFPGVELYWSQIPTKHPHNLTVNSFVRWKLAHVGFCIPASTNEQDIKINENAALSLWGHFNLFLAKHRNKALITGQPLLRFFFP